MRESATPPSRSIVPHLARLGVVVAVCVLVYWVGLGSYPFIQSEGHRVAPGWAMLESGEWSRVTMFGMTYLRKPPGMPWAIAASSAVFGETEFAARVPSALASTLMCVVAYAFTAYWFGRGRGVKAAAGLGLVAGLGQALMPQLWNAGRTAEIEALNNLMTQVGVLGLVHLFLLRWRGGAGGRLVMMGLVACGWIGAALAKGPASLPVLVGALVAMVWIGWGGRDGDGSSALARSRWVCAHWSIWLPLMIAGGVIALLARWIVEANADPLAVREDVSGFLWSADKVLGVAMLIPAAWAAALPVSLAWLFVWGKDARAEAAAEPSIGAAREVARLLGVVWIVAMLVFVVAGVHNQRYAMPAACLFAPMMAYVCLGVKERLLMAHRVKIARAMGFGVLGAWAAAMVVLSVGSWMLLLRDRFDSRARAWEVAETIAKDLAGPRVAPVTLWADDMIEARPDFLLYMERAAAGLAEPFVLDVVWKKWAMREGEVPPGGAYLLVRSDGQSGEDARYRENPALVLVDDLGALTDRYDAKLYRVVERR